MLITTIAGPVNSGKTKYSKHIYADLVSVPGKHLFLDSSSVKGEESSIIPFRHIEDKVNLGIDTLVLDFNIDVKDISILEKFNLEEKGVKFLVITIDEKIEFKRATFINKLTLTTYESLKQCVEDSL